MATTEGAACPSCGAARMPDALFCEECAYDFTGGRGVPAGPGEVAGDARPSAPAGQAPAVPRTARVGDESPLDVGWTGPAVPAEESPAPPAERCRECGVGFVVDGYCDQCGSRARDPRDHFEESPAPWVGGACDIGVRHTRNEDAMALAAEPAPLSAAAVVVCDGVSRSTDSHIASLAASRAARDVLAAALPRGMGTRDARIGAAERRLAEAVLAAQRAVVGTTKDTADPNPPSCTLVAALVVEGLAVVGNVGDSRAYWLPDDPAAEARQLSRDDSFAAEQISDGVPRKEAEAGAQAHAITRWLGSDSPDDLAPHTVALDLDTDGWLMACSDGLWNYCSEASGLRELVRDTVARLGAAGRHPTSLARALVDYANERGGMDNITVALVRVGDIPAAEPVPSTTEGEDTPDGTVHR